MLDRQNWRLLDVLIIVGCFQYQGYFRYLNLPEYPELEVLI